MLFSAAGCSRRTESSAGQSSTGQNNPEGGTKMAEIDPAVSAALARMEATGKLEGTRFEHYVGGGLPPPYYRSDQLMFLVWEGRDTIQFRTPNYNKKPAKEGSYPFDVYRLPAQPEDVKTIARILREGRAFGSSTTPTKVADAVRTELVLTIAGRESKAIYSGFPPALAPLAGLVDTLIARAKSQGQHKLEP